MLDAKRVADLMVYFAQGRGPEGLHNNQMVPGLDNIGGELHSKVSAVSKISNRRKSLPPGDLFRIVCLRDHVPGDLPQNFLVQERMRGTSIQEVARGSNTPLDRMALVCLGCTPNLQLARHDPPEGTALARMPMPMSAVG